MRDLPELLLSRVPERGSRCREMAPPVPELSGRALPLLTREEVAKHQKHDDLWIIIHGNVYNVTNWSRRHPGGEKVLQHHGGQDATAAYESFHIDKKTVQKYMASFKVGQLSEEEAEQPEIIQDFLEMRAGLEQKGFFKASPWFFLAHTVHIILMEVLAIFVLWYFGTSWLPWLTALVLISAMQAQAGWLQHDFGHLTVCNTSKWNHILHYSIVNFVKGASAYWWNRRHFQHHTKPNVYLKDPDITIPYVFLLGDVIPVKWGKKRWGKMPYHWQHKYFFLLGPPLLLPIYFHVEIVLYILSGRKWVDLITTLLYYLRFHLIFAPLLGGFWPSFFFYFGMRILESHWFVWSTQISHVPMNIDLERKRDWVSQQMVSTCNAHQSFFADWFLGHLNFQIEHHLFPTMPRHNFYAATPYVKQFCNKHGLEYKLKPVFTAFADIVSSLRDSGKLWADTYQQAEKEAKTKKVE